MSAPLFSIVCVYNDEKTLNDWLLKGLEGQTREFELVLVDNTTCAFRSAADALNYGAEKAKGEYLLFAHQDVRLLSADWLEKAEAFLRSKPDTGVAGVAGMIKTHPCIMSFGTIPKENRVWTIYSGPGKEFSEYDSLVLAYPAEVQTLDEQLLIVPRQVFGKLKFDADTCPGWHLYAVDYALSVKKMGFKAYVLPIPVWHMSNGDINRGYYASLARVLTKHRGEKSVYTTCGLWHTSGLVDRLSLLMLAVKGEVGRWLGRNERGAAPYLERLKLFMQGEHDAQR